MIKMTRLRRINWHNFQDDTIDFKNITDLLGVRRVEERFWALFIRNREQRTVICALDTRFHILVSNLRMKR